MSRNIIRAVRDGCKSQYEKKEYCERCGAKEELVFHHFHTVSLVVERFLVGREGLPLDEFRPAIYAAHRRELIEDGVTLCVSCHHKLHKIYGMKPSLLTAEKQRRWIQITKEI